MLQSGDRPELRATADEMIRRSGRRAGTQRLSEHLLSGRSQAAADAISETQTTGHELYNIGHMLQGAIAYYRATGDRTLLDAGMRFVDHFLIPGYGPGANQMGIVAGHPEIEMSLIELYRTTGQRQYVELAGYILHGDERIPLRPDQIKYMFCGIPFTSRTRLEGHAVRAMYACCGATDYYLETGDPAYLRTLNTLWDDLTSHQLYVTGGVGARQEGEAFGDPYELPNARAYGESCAAIGNMMWNWRMLAASGEAKFTDVIERALYNGINSGMSLDGTTYCYRNPLAFDPSGDARYVEDPEGKIRNPWYYTTCCPPNLERTFAALPGYFYSTSAEGVYVHLYDNSELDWHLENGVGLKVTQKTNYPWDGGVGITVNPAEASEFTFYLRIPGWADQAQVAVNGKSVTGAKPGEYLPIHRHWAPGDVIQLSVEVKPQVIEANPRVADDTGRVAIQRGPLIYCLEEIDQPSGVSLSDVAVNAGRHAAEQFQTEFKSDLLGGMVVLHHTGAVYERGTAETMLYSQYNREAKSRKVALTFIPYYAWANRQATSMQV